MQEITLQAQSRETDGRGGARRLRRNQGLVPAVLYGGDKEPLSLSLPADSINRLAQEESFYTHILKLVVDKYKHDVIVKEVQRHPYKRQVLHLDFLRVLADRKLTIQAPIHLLNEATAAGVREGGIVNHLTNELEIRCLPKDIPEAIEVDIAELGQEQTLHLSQIKLPPGVELVHPVSKDHDPGIVAIHKPRAVEVAEPVEEAAAEAAEGEGDKDAGGETPAGS